MPWARSKHCEGCCPFARPAKKSGMTGATGKGWNLTSRVIPARNLRMESVRIACAVFIRNTPFPKSQTVKAPKVDTLSEAGLKKAALDEGRQVSTQLRLCQLPSKPTSSFPGLFVKIL